MKEPYRSEFVELIRKGAGTLDIHDAQSETPFTLTIPAYEALVEREVERVDIHRSSLNQLLETYVGKVDRVLDVGCGTGATTVAMALSNVLDADEVIGLDPNELSLQAASVRAKGYGLSEERCRFETITAGAPLPYDDGTFQLTTCVSVIEYVHAVSDRYALAAELQRVTRPGGFVLLITPNPFRVRDYHTKRFFGDWRRADGYPWSSPPWELGDMLKECDPVAVRGHQLQNALRKLGVNFRAVPSPVSWLGWLLPWQKFLVQKRAG